MSIRPALLALLALPLLSGCLDGTGRGGDEVGGGLSNEGGGAEGDAAGAGGGGDEGVDIPEDGKEGAEGDEVEGGGAEDGAEGEGPPDGVPCEEDGDCAGGEICSDRVCSPPECRADGDCGSLLQACQGNRCRDRCLGPGTCLRGGVCIDGTCLPPECNDKGDCGDPLKTCEEGVCIDLDPCEGDGDCDGDSQCVDGVCEPLPTCGGDRNCEGEEICQRGRCRERTGCEGEEQCADDEDCVGGRCVPFVCRGQADCDEGTMCLGGECLEPEASPISEVVILTRGRTLFPGQEVQFSAIAIDAAGDIVATGGFTWETSEAAVVGIGEDDGLATAGEQAGSSEIRAGIADVEGEIVRSEPVVVTVAVIEEPEGARIRVTDAWTGDAIAGVTVITGESTAVTNAEGVVEFDALAEGGVTVFSADHDTVTVIGSSLDALHIPLRPRMDSRSQAGFTGQISFEDVSSEGALELGLAGASLAAGFTHFDLGGLVGEVFNTTISALGQSIDLPLPGGLTLVGDLPLVGYTEVKTEYQALADPGFRVAWSFAGRMEVGPLMQMAMGGNFDVGVALTTLLPYFESFEHGVRSAPDVVALPRVQDEDDIDGDGDTNEMVPDYDRFPQRRQRPDHEQVLRVAITVPAPPAGRGAGTDTTLIFAGTDVEGIGFVPLGVSSSTEAETIAMKMAAPHSGIEGGTYAITALSARIDQALPRELSALVSRHVRLPVDVNLGDRFLPYPAGAEWNDEERLMQGVGVDGASVHRAVLESEEGRWTIWFVSEDNLNAALPESPDGVADQADGASPRFEAINLTDGMTLDDLLVEGGAGDLSDVDTLSTAFSRILP